VVIDLARLRQFQGSSSEAASLMERAVRIWAARLGSTHPWTALGQANLAALCTDLNRVDEADALFQESLPILEHAYGPEHPDLGTILKSYGDLLRKRHRYREAKIMSRRARILLEKTMQESPAARQTIDIQELRRRD